VLDRSADGDVVTLSELDGGVRLVTETIPGARSVSVGIWVGVGSVDETPGLSGASHYLEHLLFKGTPSRTARDIAVAIDTVGGDFNAFTAHEYTCYYAQVLAAEAKLAVDIVSDVVLNALVQPHDVDVERQVILEELAMRDDNPEDMLGDTFGAAVFDGEPIARHVIGTEASIEALTRTQINGYYRRRYQPDRMVVSMAGGVDHAAALGWVQEAFAQRLGDGVVPRPARRVSPHRQNGLPQFALVERDTEQAHLCVGTRALGRDDPRRHALEVFSTALGGGMSSRLFRAIREQRGLAYSCYSAISAYAGTGSFSVYVGCQPDNLAEASVVLAAELHAAVAGLDADEITRAKSQVTGSMILGLEDAEARMSRNGKNVLVRDRYRSLDEEIAAVAAVTADDVADVAAAVLSRPVTVALVGPYGSSDDAPAPLRELVSDGIRRRK
jgi:predicted Zn-dependent peptidase